MGYAEGRGRHELRIASHDVNDELQGYLRDDANETDEAGKVGESLSRGDCTEHKLLGVCWTREIPTHSARSREIPR